LELVLRELTGTKDPLPHAKSPFYVVVRGGETDGGGEEASKKTNPD